MRRLIAPLALAGALVAGCGGGASTTSGSAGLPTTKASAAPVAVSKADWVIKPTSAVQETARQACESAVSAQLKAPSTAVYTGWWVYTKDDGSWWVNANVDSENSFGAMLRSMVLCNVTSDGGQVISADVVESH